MSGRPQPSARTPWGRRIAACAALALASGAAGAARLEAAAPGPAPQVSYWSVWADRDGGTHVSRCAMTSFELQTFAPPAAAEWVLRLSDAVSNVIFAVQPTGWVGQWHKNPEPQWVIPLSGRWYVETTDGARVEMGPGEASFGGDQGARATGGRTGHRSGTIGDEPAVLMVVQLQAGSRVGEACPFR